jgi:hypothetical protein
MPTSRPTSRLASGGQARVVKNLTNVFPSALASLYPRRTADGLSSDSDARNSNRNENQQFRIGVIVIKRAVRGRKLAG